MPDRANTLDSRKKQTGILLAVILTGCCFAPLQAVAGKAYWLWAGITVPSDACATDAVYILQGYVRREPSGQAGLVPLGLAPYPAPFNRIVLVYRLADLVQPSTLMPVVLARAHAWERKGIKIAGIQIDFDARTLRLPAYAEFLKGLRAILPSEYQLSITGLADWGTTAPLGDLALVSGVVDEIDFQMYQGRRPVDHWETYARSLIGQSIRFRLGLLESMTPSAGLAEALATDPGYRGPIYFELKDALNDPH